MNDSSMDPLPENFELNNRYIIIKLINQGGFGNIYKAQDKKFNQMVALKEAYFNDEDTRKQFFLEADVLLNINSPYVVRAIDKFEENKRFYLVMEFIDGPSIEDLQIDYFHNKKTPIPEDKALKIISSVCQAVQILHDQNILHRDIKPANIKLRANGEPVLLDLGLAKLYHDPESKTLRAAQAYTPGYAPLEQCAKDGKSSETTDVYAIGATMYYTLTGRQPLESIERAELMSAHQKEMLRPSQHWPKISKDVDDIVLKAMQMNASNRYKSPADMKRSIDTVMERRQKRSGKTLTQTCPNCRMENPSDGLYCSKCGTMLSNNTQSTADTKSAITAIQTLPAENTNVQAASVNLMKELPSEPEKAPKRKVVRRMSGFASLALFLGSFSLIPVIGMFLGFFGIVTAGFAIAKIIGSRGARYGVGRAITAIILSIFGIGETIFWVSQLFQGKYF